MQIGRIECDFLKGFKIRTNYVSISYCNLEQVTPIKYPNQKYVYIYIYIYIYIYKKWCQHCVSAASSKSMIIKPEESDTKF